MNITFGIITDGNQPARVKRLVDSIKAINAPCEIVLVGGKPIDGVTHIPFDETACKDCICHKKNLITAHSQAEIIVYLHDYLEFEPDWWENFVSFGLDWDIQLNPIIMPNGKRYVDWRNCIDYSLEPYDKPFDDTMYINGAYWVAKKWVGESFPQNKSLRWKEFDEIDFSNRIKNAKLKVVMNTDSKVKTQYNKVHSHTGKPVDVVYKTYSGDKDFLWDSLRSVKKFVLNYGKIFLLTDDDLGAIPTDISDLDITVIQNPIHTLLLSTSAKNLQGWHNQMLIKMNLFQYLPAEIDRVLLLDSDMIVNGVWDLAKEPNKWIWIEWDHIKNDAGKTWKAAADSIFGSGTKKCMQTPGWFITRDLLSGLSEHISTIVGEPAFSDEYWKKFLRKVKNHFVEFELLGNYLLLINSLNYEIVEFNGFPYPIKQFRSWDGYETKNKDGVSPKEEIQSILNAPIVSETPESLPAKEEKKKGKKTKVEAIEVKIETSFEQVSVYDKTDLPDDDDTI